MGEYLQQQRKLRVTTPLGENELEVKLTVNVGKKMEQKLVYTRVP